jgi:cytochrome c-type biogenesis protein
MHLTLYFAALAGLVSFLSPCVLPIIPGFLAYLAGTSVADSATHRKDIFLNSVFFVLGFSTIFALLGVLLNTLLSAVAYDAQIWLARIGGAIIIFFGLFLVGLIHIPFLQREFRVTVKTRFSAEGGSASGGNSKFITSFLFGAAFAAGWTPCVGAVLGGILGLATREPGIAFTLLLTYAIGLGIPFLLVGLFAAASSKLIRRIGPYVKYVNIIFGALLIIIGILAFTRELSRFANLEILNRILLK